MKFGPRQTGVEWKGRGNVKVGPGQTGIGWKGRGDVKVGPGQTKGWDGSGGETLGWYLDGEIDRMEVEGRREGET